MGLTRVTEKESSVLRICPGDEQTAAICVCLLIACVLGAAAVHGRNDPILFVVLSMLACAFGAVAFFVRNQQRTVEVNLQEQVFYVLGRQRSDMYMIPFHDITALRVGCFARERSIRPMPEGLRLSRLTRTGKDRFFLDILRRDSGYESIDRSVVGADIQELAELLAERTGLPVVDEAGFGMAYGDRSPFPEQITRVPDSPPPASVLSFHENRRLTSCAWPLSPGPYILTVMGVFSIGLLLLGAMGMYELSREGGNLWLGSVVALVAGFFAYQILWRFLRALMCKGFVYMDAEGVHCGVVRLGREEELFCVSVPQIHGFRVLAPRLGPCTLEVLTAAHDRYTVARITPGLSPVTIGDLHWLNAKFNEVLRSKRFA